MAIDVAAQNRRHMGYGLEEALHRRCGWAVAVDSCCGGPWEVAARHIPPVGAVEVEVDMKKHAAVDSPRSAIAALDNGVQAEADIH